MAERASRAGVVVIGDAGRSPRMARHAAALARRGWEVDLLALRGKPPSPDLAGVRFVPIEPPRAFRMTVIAARLMRILLANRYDVVIVQNPPAFPTIPVVLASGSPFIVDWHNLTAAMLALRFRSRPLLAFARWCELLFGRAANGHLAVTPELADHLRARGIREISVLPDAPVTVMSPLPRASGAFPEGLTWLNDAPREGPLLVAPTSWTADEDFEVLVDAFAEVAGVTLVVTGDGAGRRRYERRLARLPVAVATGWLEEGQYHELLRSADAGLSLHRSASGLDFPMKIVDFLGACLPVIALDYGEALRRPLEGTGASLFTTAAELAAIVRAGSYAAAAPPRRLWDQAWEERAAALVRTVARA